MICKFLIGRVIDLASVLCTCIDAQKGQLCGGDFCGRRLKRPEVMEPPVAGQRQRAGSTGTGIPARSGLRGGNPGACTASGHLGVLLDFKIGNPERRSLYLEFFDDGSTGATASAEVAGEHRRQVGPIIDPLDHERKIGGPPGPWRRLDAGRDQPASAANCRHD
jgi:hypothetical protein